MSAQKDTHSNKDEKIVDVMGSTEVPPCPSPSLSPSSSSSSPFPSTSPPRPSPAALPSKPGNSFIDLTHSEQQSGSADNSDNPSHASGLDPPEDSRTPVQETNFATTYTPDSQDGEPERREDDEKLNEPVQESQDREEGETDVGGQDGVGCMGGKEEPDNTSK
ncbi:uncharacterized protein Hap1MRO34_020549 isoform 1-T2 [Clarias gariepinus]